MSAEIISFPSQRFTVVDAERLHEMALAMIDLGVWGRVQYVGASQGPGFNIVLIYLPDSSNPIFTLERHRDGSYSLIDCTTTSLIGIGHTLDEALEPLEPVLRLAGTAPGQVDLKRVQWNIW